MMGLTQMQTRCLNVIKDYHAAHGCSPSFDDMKERLGLGSKSSVNRLVVALEERGAIRRLSHRARAIEVIEPSTVDVRMLEAMQPDNLRQMIAVAAGLLAHKSGVSSTRETLDRIGARLAGAPHG